MARITHYPGRFVLAISTILLILAAIIFFYALSVGSVDTTFDDVLNTLAKNGNDTMQVIIMDIRLPRVITGFLVGGMLALAGALMQVLLRNPLAEPYILGISGGASVFALLAIMAGLSGFFINLGAFLGAVISMFLVFVISQAGSWNPLRVLLTGVVIAAGWGALISFLLAISPATQLHGMLFWLMGDLSYASYSFWNLLVLIIGFVLSMLIAKSLNLMARGDLQAKSLGVSVEKLRYFIYFLASVLTAAAVTQAGSIGFIGLIIPHLVRITLGSDHRLLLPVCVITGGSLLVIADCLARSIIAPQQLPVGILTAMIGVPLFLVLLQTTARRQS